MPTMKKKLKRGFPWVIFLFTLFLLLLISVFISTGYFYHTVKIRTGEIESDTKKNALAIVEALGNMAELSYSANDYTKLKKLFKEKIGQNKSIDAFFILTDGKIVVHSNSAIEKELEGNIANDEISYNLELILLPVQKKEKEVLFLDYNIVNQKIPFNKIQRKWIKKYIYPGISSIGWIATKAVYNKNAAIGTVSFIINKEKIYAQFHSLMKEAIIILVALAGLSLFISIIISLVVYMRFRSIWKSFNLNEPKAETVISTETVKLIKEVVLPKTEVAPPKTKAAEKKAEAFNMDKKKSLPDLNRPVKDAIPVIR